MTTLAEPAVNPLSALVFELASCVCNELSLTISGPPCWCGVWPGLEISWEHCTDCPPGLCGMGWSRLVLIAPYDDFPEPVIDLRCTKPLAAQLEVGALRCIPVPEEGEVNDPNTMGEVALRQYEDMLALRRAILCCDDVQIALGTYFPLGPQGGCVGGSWTAYLPLD